MKMTTTDYNIIYNELKNVVNNKELLKQFYNYKKEVIKEQNYSNRKIRLAWDLFHALNIYKKLAVNYDDNVYLIPYNDNHYTTALLRACKELKINIE